MSHRNFNKTAVAILLFVTIFFFSTMLSARAHGYSQSSPASSLLRATSTPTKRMTPTPTTKAIFSIPGVPIHPKVYASSVDTKYDHTCKDGTTYHAYKVYYYIRGMGANVSSKEVSKWYVTEMKKLGWNYANGSYPIGQKPGYTDLFEVFWLDAHRNAPKNSVDLPYAYACFKITIAIGSKGIYMVAKVP